MRLCFAWARSWKYQRLYCEKVDLLYKEHLTELRLAYRKFSGKYALPAETPYMSIDVRAPVTSARSFGVCGVACVCVRVLDTCALLLSCVSAGVQHDV